LIDEEGRQLEIERLRELVKLGVIKKDPEGTRLIEKEEENNEFVLIDEDPPLEYARVFFHLGTAKWRTKIFGEPTRPRPIKQNFTHLIGATHKGGSKDEFFDKANFERAMQLYSKSRETLLPQVERPRGKKVKTAIEL
jgi:hypothetical protein